DMGQAPGRDGEAEAVAAPAQRSGRGREAQEEHPDRARQARRSAQTDPGDDVLDRRPGGVRDVRADGRADRARGAQAHRRGRGARGPRRRLAREAVPGAGGPRRHGPAAARAETEAGTAPRGLARRSQAAREGREGSRARPGRRRRAVPLSTETSPARSPGATFVALFIAALVIWFVLRVAEVLILVFLAVLAAVYFSAITDQLERRFLMPRWVGLLCAVVGTVAVIAGAGATLRAWVVGQLLAMVVLAVFTAIGLWVLRVPYWLAFGIFTGLVAIVPFFGTLVSTLLPALFILGTGNWLQALAVAAWGVAVHFFEANLIAPLIMEKKVALPPVLTIASVLVMGTLLGAI